MEALRAVISADGNVTCSFPLKSVLISTAGVNKIRRSIDLASKACEGPKDHNQATGSNQRLAACNRREISVCTELRK
jgi:hypothetical protein